MQCTKCGLDLPAGARHCPKCGTVNELASAMPPEKRKVKPIAYVMAALAAIALIAIVVAVIAGGGKNVTQAPGAAPGPPGNVVSAPPGSPSPGNIVSAPPGSPGPGTPSPAGTPKPKPPKAVVDYLNFVKGVEEHRQKLLGDTGDALMLTVGGQSQGLLDMIDMATNPDSKESRDPLADSKQELNRQYKNWLETMKYFDKQTAPNECREFSGAYRDVLFREAKTIGELAVSFNSVNIMDPKDMSKLLGSLQKMKGDPNIQQSIDASADNADAKLTQLVSGYDMEKPFNVPREQKTSGSIMGF